MRSSASNRGAGLPAAIIGAFVGAAGGGGGGGSPGLIQPAQAQTEAEKRKKEQETAEDRRPRSAADRPGQPSQTAPPATCATIPEQQPPPPTGRHSRSSPPDRERLLPEAAPAREACDSRNSRLAGEGFQKKRPPSRASSKPRPTERPALQQEALRRDKPRSRKAPPPSQARSSRRRASSLRPPGRGRHRRRRPEGRRPAPLPPAGSHHGRTGPRHRSAGHPSASKTCARTGVERVEDGGRRKVIQEPGNRIIVKENNRAVIRHDEAERFSRRPGAKSERRADGNVETFYVRSDGVRIVTVVDGNGRLLRRYRRDRDGRERNIIDNRRFYRNLGVGVGIGVIGHHRPQSAAAARDHPARSATSSTTTARRTTISTRRWMRRRSRTSTAPTRWRRSATTTSCAPACAGSTRHHQLRVRRLGGGARPVLQARAHRARHPAAAGAQPGSGGHDRGAHRRGRLGRGQPEPVGPARFIRRGHPVGGVQCAARKTSSPRVMASNT